MNEYINEFLEKFNEKHKIIIEQQDSLTFYKYMINGELRSISISKEDSDHRFQSRLIKEFAKEMCELQKKECVKSYQNSPSLYRVSDDVLNAPFPKELGE